jgi:hypothetical protein
VARVWSDEAKRVKALYVGTMYGSETAGRASEFTNCELGSQDHCARTDDFTFVVETPAGTKNVLGSGLAALPLADSVEGHLPILECRVRTVSSKGKILLFCLCLTRPDGPFLTVQSTSFFLGFSRLVSPRLFSSFLAHFSKHHSFLLQIVRSTCQARIGHFG